MTFLKHEYEDSVNDRPPGDGGPNAKPSYTRVFNIDPVASDASEGICFTGQLTEPGIREYRVIDRVAADQVLIYLIVDGRRDMQSALLRRLLGG
jgi:hypothetical protein